MFDKEDYECEFFSMILNGYKQDSKHPKCKGYKYWTDCGYEFDCGYETTIDCDQCKYGMGIKDPEAKCNQ